MIMKNILPVALLASFALTGPSLAEEATLRAITVFQPGTTFAKPFDRFVANVNEAGKGLVQIDVIGGTEAMPPFEIGSALRNQVFDLANTTAVFHANLVPEGLAMTLSDQDMATLRENGGYDLLNKIHEDKARIHWLGRLIQNVPYHVFLAKSSEEVSFEGLKLRSVPVYQPFFEALEAVPVRTAPGEVYTALERGIIDGYGWASVGIFDLGWQEETEARVDPGFYQVELGVYFSLATWNGLNEEQKAFLEEQMIAVESDAAGLVQIVAEEEAKMDAAGIERIKLPEAEVEGYLSMAQDAGWNSLISSSPEFGEKLRELFIK